MKRFHAIEFEDFSWFPQQLRDFMTDFFQFQMVKLNLYEPAIDILHNLVKTTKHYKIVDLCSGGSGPIVAIRKQILEKYDSSVNITLTDYYPNIPAFKRIQKKTNGNVKYYPESVDAREIPEKLCGIRTIFSAFHHFRPNDAVAILKNAVKNNSPIAIFEISNRSISSFFQVLFGGPISLFFITPFLCPFSLKRVIFTYFIPLIPFFCVWDGFASNFRSYNERELKELIDMADPERDFFWEIKTLRGKIPGIKIGCLSGRPKL